jgi:hypothetical protein
MLLYDKIQAVLREQGVDDSYELIRALETMIEREIEEARDDGYDAGSYDTHCEFNTLARYE